MKRIILTLAALLCLAVSTQATSITISSTTISNSRFTGLPASQTYTVNTSGTTVTKTSGNAFNTSWPAGLKILINGTQYEIASVTSTTVLTLTSSAGTQSSVSATLYPWVEMRVYALQGFVASDGTIVPPGTPGSGNFYTRAGVSVISGVAYIPSVTLQSTTDAQSTADRQARYYAGFYSASGAFLDGFDGLTNFQLPATPTSTGWAAIRLYNRPGTNTIQNYNAFTQSESDTRYQQRTGFTTGDILYANSAGNLVALPIGSTGKVLTVSAGGLPSWATASGGSSSGIQYFDVRTYGALCDGSTNDSTAFASAITAAVAAKGIVSVPAGTCIAQIAGQDNLIIQGSGVQASVIKWTSNSAIFSVSGTCNQCQVSDLTFLGDASAGSGNIGLDLRGSTYYYNVLLRNVNVTTTGGVGIYWTQPYSSFAENIRVSGTTGFPILYDAAARPSNKFRNIYVSLLTATTPTGYRIKQGIFSCDTCNGVDNVIAASKWAVVGKKNGVDGDTSNTGAVFECNNCNLESWVGNGVLAYGGSLINLTGATVFAMDASGNGSGKPIQFDNTGNGTDFYAQYVRRGMISDSVQFANTISNYANSQVVHANGFAPIEIQGVGAAISGNAFLTSFYNSTAAAAVPLSRKGGTSARVTVTGSTTFAQPGVRYIEANCGAACTITLPWPGWYKYGDTITVKDVSGNASTNNVTIAADAGGSINTGGGGVTLNENYQSATFVANDTATDWRLVSVGHSNGVATRLAIWDSNVSQGSASGLVWDSGNSALKSPGRFWGANNSAGAPTFSFTSDSTKGFYHNAANEIGIAIAGANKFIIGAGYLDINEVAAPAASSASYARIYADSTAHRLKVSNNTGAYTNLLLASDLPSNTRVVFSDSGAVSGEANLTYTKVNSTSGGYLWVGKQNTTSVDPPFLITGGQTLGDTQALWNYYDWANQTVRWRGLLDSIAASGYNLYWEDATTRRFTFYQGGGMLITGKTINTDADNTIAALSTTSTLTKNDSNTRKFYSVQIKPTFNAGASNANTTWDILATDSTNTATTGLTVNLLNLSYGGSSKFKIDSGGYLKTYSGSAPTDGQLLIGNTANGRFEAATLTAGSNITITNAGGSITIAAGGGTPGGANTNVQINDAGAFYGDSQFTMVKATGAVAITKSLTVGGSGGVTTSPLTVTGPAAQDAAAITINQGSSPTSNGALLTAKTSSGTIVFTLTASGAPSAPGTGGSNRERFGANSSVTGDNGTALGNASNVDGTNGTAIGFNAHATGGIAIGRDSYSTGGIALGSNNTSGAAAANEVVLAGTTLYLGVQGKNYHLSSGSTIQAANGNVNLTDGAGSDLIIQSGLGVGTATGTASGRTSSVRLATGVPTSTGTTLNTAVDRLIINGTRKPLTNSSAISLFDVALPALAGASGTVRYTVYATDGTEVQVRSGVVRWSCVNKSGTYITESSVVNEAASVSSGTLTATWGFSNGTNKTTLQITATSSLTTTVFYVLYTVENNSVQALTIL